MESRRGRAARKGRLMATVRRTYSLDYVATILGESVELIDAIVSNDDNLSYGTIISVRMGLDEAIISLTDDGIDELRSLITDARCSPDEWEFFLQSVVADPEIIERVKAQSPR